MRHAYAAYHTGLKLVQIAKNLKQKYVFLYTRTNGLLNYLTEHMLVWLANISPDTR